MTALKNDSTNIYERVVEGPFAIFCGGGSDDDSMEDCLSIAEVKGGGFALRDTKTEGEGRELRGSVTEIRAFAEGVLADQRFAVQA